jgi:hypothetical protein
MNYLAALKQAGHEHTAQPPGALAEKTPFARVYNHLLPSSRRFTSAALGPTRRYCYDGEELTKSVLVQLRLPCIESGVAASLETVRQAAIALAAANPAEDPWDAALETFLNDAIAIADVGGDCSIARITIHGAPHWFVAMRDIKLELGAYGAGATRRVRLAMKSLGWRERRAFAWGRRLLGFSRKID